MAPLRQEGTGSGVAVLEALAGTRRWRGVVLPGPARGAHRIGPALRVCLIAPLGYGLFRPDAAYAFAGAEVQGFLLSRELSADPGLEVYVWTTGRERSSVERHGSVTVVKRRERHRVSGGTSAGLRGWLQAVRGSMPALLEMRRVMRALDADIYLYAGAEADAGAYAVMARLMGRRFVFVMGASAGGAAPWDEAAQPQPGWYRLGIRLADAVVCQTQAHKARLASRLGRQSVVIRAGHPCVQAEDRSGTSVLWIGSVDGGSQAEMFVELARRVPKERCEMVVTSVPGQEHLVSTLRERATGLTNLTVVNNVPWTEVGRFFERAKVLVETSTIEGVPQGFVQATMHGVPILSWQVDPDGILSRYGIGLCADGSFDRLVELVGTLCESDRVRRDYGARARGYAGRRHDLNQVAERYKTLIRSLTGRRRWFL